MVLSYFAHIMEKNSMMKRIVTILLVAVCSAASSQSPAQTTRRPPVVHVAIVTDGPSERTASLRALFLEEMRAVNRGELDNQAPPDLQFEANRRDIYRWSIVLKGSSLLCELKINNDN